MSTLAVPTVSPVHPRVVYPESDGKPMAENTLQFEWITKIVGGLRHLFADRPDVFVAGDLFWYPVQGDRDTVIAPDALVAFGRPAGHRGSYRQWEEGGVAPQVVFEVLSPGNRFGEMSAKFDFYSQYGVEEYYLFNPEPDRLELSGFLRRRGRLTRIEAMNGHVSPRLGIKFEMGEDGLRILRPDGRPFETFEELALREEQERQRADGERERARLAEEQAKRAAEQAKQAEDRARQEQDRADQLQRELDRLRRQSGPPGA